MTIQSTEAETLPEKSKDKRMLKKVEFTFINGEIEWLEGDEARRWEQWVNSALVMDAIHAIHDAQTIRPFEWKKALAPTPQNSKDETFVYKTLEQQIKELWASRGLRVVQETFLGAEYRRKHGEPSAKAHRWIIEAAEDSEKK